MDKKILVISLVAAGNVFGMNGGNSSPYSASPVFFNQQQMRSASPVYMTIESNSTPRLQQKRTPSMRNRGYQSEVYDMFYELAAKAYTGQLVCYDMVSDLARNILALDDPEDWTKGYNPDVIQQAKADVVSYEERNELSDSNLLRFSWFFDDALDSQMEKKYWPAR